MTLTPKELEIQRQHSMNPGPGPFATKRDVTQLLSTISTLREENRRLEKALDESIDFSSLTLTEENDISGFGNCTDAEELGLYNKFEVKRTDGQSGPGGKHEGCRYFVLDLDHDKFSIHAIQAYADACEAEYPALARDLRDIAWHSSDFVHPASPEKTKAELLQENTELRNVLGRVLEDTAVPPYPRAPYRGEQI